ncbi:hypothetical protein SEUCBS139899_008233 [Sporothrix eucalyptigena]|uniref:AB hydrolase-1 domain-containing protein n=1 Tax=Sporothrix eucalyptigena TaxID=1812306 RepID=A0ABP0CE75_9PEZI
MPDAQSHFAQHQNGDVHYETAGTGNTTLVLIHGWCCSARVWEHQLPLADKYRLILVDLPGHGRSPARADGTYSLEQSANAVRAVLDHAGVSRVTLVGHSMGGTVCTMFLRLHASLVERVLYIDSFFRAPEAYLTQAERQAKRALVSSDTNLARLLPAFCCSPHTPPSVLAAVIQMMVNDASTDVRLGTVMQDAWHAHALGRDECYPDIPALHICTEKYSFVDVDWPRLLPRLEMDSSSWRDHGHFFFQEDPERFNLQVEKVLSSGP